MSNRSATVRVLGAMAALVVAVLAWALWREQTEHTIRPAPAADSTAPGLRSVTLIVPAANGDGLVAESREVAELEGLHERVSALVALLTAEPEGGRAPALPPGTLVRHVFLDGAGELTVDLSRPFLSRLGGGSRTEDLMVGALVRTLAGNIPGVRRVRVLCVGRPIAVPGAHVPLDRAREPRDWPVVGTR